MRLFFDANELTYIAVFEGYLCEGTQGEFVECKQTWMDLQKSPLDTALLSEVEALRTLYQIDEQAHFDWFCSDLAVSEILSIKDRVKRSHHYPLLDRIVEHRRNIYSEDDRSVSAVEIERLRSRLFPSISKAMKCDASQYCEAILVEADYFVTNDANFIKAAAAIKISVTPMRASELPFIKWTTGT